MPYQANREQPSTETVTGSPVVLREESDELVVEVWVQGGRKLELKRFSNSK